MTAKSTLLSLGAGVRLRFVDEESGPEQTGAEHSPIAARSHGELSVGSTAQPRLEHHYTAHARAIFIHCRRLLGDAASAEDATQEVFLRVRRLSRREPEPSQVRPWLFRIATNHCLNELRRRGVRVRRSQQADASCTANPEESLAEQDHARRFLKRLPPRARAIAWLTYVDGMRQHEVAATLGVSRRTVVNHLRQVRGAAIACRAG